MRLVIPHQPLYQDVKKKKKKKEKEEDYQTFQFKINNNTSERNS